VTSDARPDVYLHSSWRSSSTYVWSKFRERNETCCYFEPLAEHLGCAAPAVLSGVSWSYANHPPLSAPYREEFLPLLLPEGGIRDFPEQSPYRQFRLDVCASRPDLIKYFAALSSHARGLDRIPVFGLVRTALKVRWFRTAIAGVHLYVMRNPRMQFLSLLHQSEKGTPYFLERPMVILGCNRDDPVLAPACEHLLLPPFEGPPSECEAFYMRYARQAGMEANYAAFHYLHLAAKSQLNGFDDCVIDVDAIAVSEVARSDAERRVARLTGFDLSFADCRPERYDSYLGGPKAGDFFTPIEAAMTALFAKTVC